MLDPYASIKPQGDEILPCKTVVKFAYGDPVIITGDTDGDVNLQFSLILKFIINLTKKYYIFGLICIQIAWI